MKFEPFVETDLEPIQVKNGYLLSAKLITKFPKHKLFYCQNRIVMTNLDNQEIQNLDIIEFIQEALSR